MTYEHGERKRAEFLEDWQAKMPEFQAAIQRDVLGILYPVDRRERLRRLRRRTLLPMLVAWSAVIAAMVVSHFTLADVPVLVVLPLLGAGTFNFITGWPIKRR